MQKTWSALIVLAFAMPMIGHAQTNINDTTGNYKLVWADEFNQAGRPDTTNWKYEYGFVRNHEDQWYQPDNAYCRNGKLVIEARKTHQSNPNYIAGSSSWKTSRQFIEYTSASLNTRGLHGWQYGRFVMRARIDVDPGMWPAFWTLGISKPWPSNGEIDIMEYYRNRLLSNIACGTDTPNHAKWFSNYKALNTFGHNWSKKFHLWRMDWDQSAISLYVDDQLMNKVDLKDLINRDGSGLNPFMQPHYILINLALGGDNGGNPALARYPARYEIDYIRVYQK